MNPRVKELLDILSEAHKELAEIRSKCGHPEVFQGLWAHERPPNIVTADICVSCNTFVVRAASELDKMNQTNCPTVYLRACDEETLA